MKITLKKRAVWDIPVSDTVHEQWLEQSRWNGLVELKRGTETIIAALPEGSLNECFADLFNKGQIEVHIVKASPDVLARLQAAQPEQSDA